MWRYEQEVRKYLMLEKMIQDYEMQLMVQVKMKTENYQQFEGHWDLGKNSFGKVIRGKSR